MTKTRYDAEAVRDIRIEAGYLSILFAAAFVLIFVTWQGALGQVLGVPAPRAPSFQRFTFALLGGLLGGTLFAMKWLYHAVAKGLWHRDRRLWRLFAPLISAGLAFSAAAIVRSVPMFDPRSVEHPPGALALGFLVGFFSDNALAKMAEVAQSVLGVQPRKEVHPERHSP